MRGGAFLLEHAADIFTPEDFSQEHRAIARSTEDFWRNAIEPNLEAIQHQQPGRAAGILRQSGELGLLGVLVPERYGGMEMDLTSAMVVAEIIARDGSYAAWHGAHAGIGTLPLLLFGTDEQKSRYLPKLATGEWIAAYCLSEPQAGSDALAAKTRADVDGDDYVLNGQKMWITNGGYADLFTVFAKIGGEHFSAFLVERSTAGVSIGAEEKKMGIKGSSTTAVFFDNVRIPKSNLLGEVGRGHIIAFNILNLGRLKLGPFAVGGSKAVLAQCLRYAKQRIAFGKSIADFGMIQQKLANMAIQLYAAESMSYRVVGLMQQLGDDLLKAGEEYAIECSYVKVFASEALDYIVDEGVQIHGGYGYHQDYLVERAYRDSRINRIFEGTNEINRLLATGMLLKRAQRGQLALVQAVKSLQAELLNAPIQGGDELERLVQNAKKTTLLLLGAAYQRFLTKIEDEQEVLAGITDVAMLTFGMESVHLRTKKHPRPAACLMRDVYLRDATEQIERSARTVLAACAEGDALRIQLAALKRLSRFDPVNSIARRREIARNLLDAERYCT